VNLHTLTSNVYQFTTSISNRILAPFNCIYFGKDYEVRRDFILQLLKDFGFHISFKPQGSVFVFAELPRSWQLSDVSPY
jgi:aspartate/methionine/tyrosine aminotransferase